MDAAALYLDLLKRCLVNWLHAGEESLPLPPEQFLKPEHVPAARAGQVRVVRAYTFDPKARSEGRDWPPTAHTMIGLRRLDNLQACVEDVLKRGVAGDLIEAGVWRGGAAILMRGVLKAHGVADRLVWAADSFQGLPAPNLEKYPQDRGIELHKFGYLAVSVEQVKANFERYGLLDAQVKLLKGWFKDTLPTVPAERFAVIRLDGDLYESTTDALTHLYPKLSVGGWLIVDDYGDIAACRQAVEDYRARQGIVEPLAAIDHTGVCWQRVR
jgi:O-methyltransferase